MAESAAVLVDGIFPEQPVRQWVLSFPHSLRFLIAGCPAIMGQVLGIAYSCVATHLIEKAEFSCKTAQIGVATVIGGWGCPVTLEYSTILGGKGACPTDTLPTFHRHIAIPALDKLSISQLIDIAMD